jgi:hypothetical protein
VGLTHHSPRLVTPDTVTSNGTQTAMSTIVTIPDVGEAERRLAGLKRAMVTGSVDSTAAWLPGEAAARTGGCVRVLLNVLATGPVSDSICDVPGSAPAVQPRPEVATPRPASEAPSDCGHRRRSATDCEIARLGMSRNRNRKNPSH